METKQPTSIKEALDAGRLTAEIKELSPGVILHHKDQEVTDFTSMILHWKKMNNPGPANIQSTVYLGTVGSFIEWVNQYKEVRTRIFAYPGRPEVNPNHRQGPPTIKAVIDYCDRKSKEVLSCGWGQHCAELPLRPSRQRKAWLSATSPMTQEDFANFLEDNLDDLYFQEGDPLDANAVLAIANDLEGTHGGSFKSKQNLQNGATRIDFQDDVMTSVEVPRELRIAIPLFEGGDRFILKIRLRFRVSRDGIRFWILFSNLEDSIENHFQEICDKIAKETEVTVFQGS